MSMNLYALYGHKVKCKTLSGGYSSDQEKAEKYLSIGQEYTINETQVEGWNTDVYLLEFPDVRFNSVFFEDVTEQSLEDTMKHPHYKRFHNIPLK